MKVIAEGVETLEQLTQLRRLKCDAGQGFLFAKAAPAQGIDGLIGLQKQWATIIASLNGQPYSAERPGNVQHGPFVAQQVRRLRAV